MTELTGSDPANSLEPELHIPGLPSDEEIATSILKSVPSDPLHMVTHGTEVARRARSDAKSKAFMLANRPRPDYYPEPDPRELEKKAREAKLLVGPGPNATPYENQLFQQRIEEQQLLRDIGKLTDKLAEVVRMDPARGPDGRLIPGKFVPVYPQSPERRAAMEYELEKLHGDLLSLHGERGERERAKALEASVEAYKGAYRRQFVQAQAKKLADKKALEHEIEERSEQVLAARGLRLGSDAQR